MLHHRETRKNMLNRKVVVLIEENPKESTFHEVTRALGLKGIDPLDYIDPESHMLSEIYKEAFTDVTANRLLAYLIKRRTSPLVFDIFESIIDEPERLVLVNSTLLSEEDVDFLHTSIPHLLTYKIIFQDPRVSANDIYDGSKSYRDGVGI